MNPSRLLNFKKIATALLVVGQAIPAPLYAGSNETQVEVINVPEIPVVDRGQPYELPEIGEVYDFTERDTPTKAVSITEALQLNSENSRGSVSFDEGEVRKLLPKFIAQMEAAFPDLQFVFIGRDTGLLARAIKAFYLSKGENDRVIHLEISEAIYKQMSDNDKAALLESNGFKVKKGVGVSRPFIIFDCTDSEKKSQSIGLREIATRMLLSAGVRWNRIRTNLAVVNLSNSIAAQIDIPEKLKDIRDVVNRQQLPEIVPVDIKMLHVPLDTLLRKHIVHGPYTTPKMDLAGRLGGVPSEDAVDEQTKLKEKWITPEQATSELEVLAKIMSSADFSASVQLKASEIGYTFKTPKLLDSDIVNFESA